jgi:hypothetical protein
MWELTLRLLMIRYSKPEAQASTLRKGRDLGTSETLA